jgi:hypothetical protein
MSRTGVASPTETATDARARRPAAVLGLVAVVLIFVPGIATALPEPAFDGDSPAVSAYAREVSTPTAQLLGMVMALGTVLWLVFAAALLTTTARGAWTWRRVAAGCCAVVFAVAALAAQASTYAFRAQPIDPDVALHAFDEGNVAFANSWLGLGGFGVLLGWDALATRTMPRWAGWWLLVAGGAMALARFTYPTAVWFFPYTAVWLWIITFCIVTLVQGGRRRSAATAP